jgi:transcriptional regulator with GAF, ATPase, and Fis domain
MAKDEVHQTTGVFDGAGREIAREHRMANQATNTALTGEMRSAYELPEVDDVAASPMEMPRVEMKRIDSLRIAVGTNLADVERWMIFATLEKCGGNKTRAAALLGVSLKTLYNRLNAYRAQGLAMDYDAGAGQHSGGDDHLDVEHPTTARGRGMEGNPTETQ